MLSTADSTLVTGNTRLCMVPFRTKLHHAHVNQVNVYFYSAVRKDAEFQQRRGLLDERLAIRKSVEAAAAAVVAASEDGVYGHALCHSSLSSM